MSLTITNPFIDSNNEGGGNTGDLPNASLTTLGIVRLSNATDSTVETLAATPKAVNSVLINSKTYIDDEIVKVRDEMGTIKSINGELPDVNGDIELTVEVIEDATLTAKGITQLTSTISDNETLSVTPKAVKEYVDLNTGSKTVISKEEPPNLNVGDIWFDLD